MDEPEINPYTYGYLIFDKQVKSALGKKAASSPMNVNQAGWQNTEKYKYIHIHHPIPSSNHNGSKT